MDPKRIRSLLERYYEGQTTLEEEAELRAFFRLADVPDEFTGEKEMFAFCDESYAVQPDKGFEERIMTSLLAPAMPRQHHRALRRQWTFTLAVAASLLVLVVSVWISSNDRIVRPSATLADTYDDPEEALMKTKETLYAVSQIMNSGTGNLKHLGRFSDGMKPMENLATMERGLEKLKPVSKFSEAVKLFKIK